MSNQSDAQDTAIKNQQGVVSTSGQAKVSTTVTPVSGTAFTLSATRDAHLYIDVTTSANLKIELGPSTSNLTTIGATQAVALGIVTLYVPFGWYVKLTGTMADLTATAFLI